MCKEIPFSLGKVRIPINEYSVVLNRTDIPSSFNGHGGNRDAVVLKGQVALANVGCFNCDPVAGTHLPGGFRQPIAKMPVAALDELFRFIFITNNCDPKPCSRLLLRVNRRCSLRLLSTPSRCLMLRSDIINVFW